MKKIIFDDPFLKKNLVESDYLYDINNHIQFLYKIINNIDFSYNKIIINSIKQKYSSYKSQDKLKHKYDENQFNPYILGKKDSLYRLYQYIEKN